MANVKHKEWLPRASDMSGKTFGRLTVLDRLENDRHGSAVWNCRCTCGTVKACLGYRLRSGKVLSCGCYQREVASQAIHGHTRVGLTTSEYNSWAMMKNRCYNKKAPNYKHYGGRGIAVCKRWRDSFVAFIQDMGLKPGIGYSIERINNDGNYTPKNCKWATQKEQIDNRRNSK
jgi:hypothetical protein